MDTYLFLSRLSSVSQDKIRGIFLDTPKKIEMPKKVPLTKEKKTKPLKESEPKSAVNDDQYKSETMEYKSESCDTKEIENEKPEDKEGIAEKEKGMPECATVENKDETENSKTFETASDVNAEIVLKEESKDSVATDLTIPKTWRWKIHDDGRKVLVSPSGDLFPTRRLALKLMLDSKVSSKEELEEMRACLVHEGWMVSSKLPTGWMMKVVKGKEIVLLSDGMKQFGMKTAIASMEKSGRFSKDIIQGLKEMEKSHQDQEDEAKQIKTEEVVMEKTRNSDMKMIKKEEIKEEEKVKVKEKADEDVKDVKEDEVKEEEVKEELTKEESVIEERKLDEKKEEVSCNLPPGWMFSLGGKVA